jgi:hypothetical protein
MWSGDSIFWQKREETLSTDWDSAADAEELLKVDGLPGDGAANGDRDTNGDGVREACEDGAGLLVDLFDGWKAAAFDFGDDRIDGEQRNILQEK